MAQPGSTSRTVLAVVWLAVGAAMLGVPIGLVATRLDTLLASHPSLMVAVVACAAGGAVAVIWAFATLVAGARYDAEGEPDRPRHRTPRELRRLSRRRIALAVPALVVAVLLVGTLAYARPFPATATAIAALESDDQVSVAERLGFYELTPARKDASGDVIAPKAGLVFTPGARVDPRAYAPLLRPLAAAGYLVIVLREPLNFAIPTSDHAAAVMANHPKVSAWAVGGHSLGGVAAATFADQHLEVAGLLLWASYPAGPMERRSLKVTSISGSADGLATPAKIAAARPDLPPTTQEVVVQGGVHAYFGDYGAQPGDGTPTIPRADAQAQIVKASAALMASIVPPAKK